MPHRELGPIQRQLIDEPIQQLSLLLVLVILGKAVA